MRVDIRTAGLLAGHLASGHSHVEVGVGVGVEIEDVSGDCAATIPARRGMKNRKDFMMSFSVQRSSSDLSLVE